MRKKSRSALTILGIVVGVTSLMLIQSTGKGAEQLILGQIEGLGSRTIAIEPGREPQGPSDFSSIFLDSLKEQDVDALLNTNNVPDLEALTPEVIVPGSVSRGGETIEATTIGSSALLGEILDLIPEQGEFFSQDAIESRASVAVIGDKIRKDLFGDSDVLGEKIKIRNRPFEIVGVFGKTGQKTFFDVDHMILVPYTTAQEYLLGINYYHELIGQVTSEEMVPYAVADIEQTLRDEHHITDPSKDDFHVMTQVDVVERVQLITGILTILLSSVAAISLVVGGIGIMNILLVSVSERTREIGLRKAVGARNRDILGQFLFESLMLTTVGGAVGVFLGVIFSYVIALVLSQYLELDWQFAFPFSASILGIGMAASVGLIFGLIPARQASKKSPIETLRYE